MQHKAHNTTAAGSFQLLNQTMAYLRLTPLAVFLLATSLMFPMKKVEAADCSGACSPFEMPPCRSTSCRCIPIILVAGFCIYPTGHASVMKIVEQHPNLCESHDDCMKKGSGTFCAPYSNPYIDYGWCFESKSEAKDFMNMPVTIAGSNSKAKGFLKMPAAIAN